VIFYCTIKYITYMQ